MPWLSLLVVGVVFIGVMLFIRYTTYKTMTERVCSKDPDNDYCRMHYKSSIDKSTDQNKNSDIVYGDTPNGGVKTVIDYVDETNKKVNKEKAVKAILREINEKNETVFETWTPLD